jgi:hypothetical protein
MTEYPGGRCHEEKPSLSFPLAEMTLSVPSEREGPAEERIPKRHTNALGPYRVSQCHTIAIPCGGEVDRGKDARHRAPSGKHRHRYRYHGAIRKRIPDHRHPYARDIPSSIPKKRKAVALKRVSQCPDYSVSRMMMDQGERKRRRPVPRRTRPRRRDIDYGVTHPSFRTQ